MLGVTCVDYNMIIAMSTYMVVATDSFVLNRLGNRPGGPGGLVRAAKDATDATPEMKH